MNDEFVIPPLGDTLLPDISDTNREHLQAAVTELFSRQAIIRDLQGDRDLYDWTRLRLSWVREVCALIGFEVFLNEDEQLIYALPGDRATLRRLRIEWTLVLLCLWYDYDVQVRAEGPPVIFAVEDFNESLKTKLGDRQPTISSLRDILAFFSSRKLVRMEYDDDFPRSRIEVLPTIRLVLPFGEIEKISETLSALMTGNPETADSENG